MDTGCLTITSTSEGTCRVYVVMGTVFHAVGPAGEGDAALAAALSWPDVTLSFDGRAKLPDKETITARKESPVSDLSNAKRAGAPGKFQTLSGNRSVLDAQFAYVGAGCLFGLVVLVGVGAAVVAGAFHLQPDAFVPAVVIALFATGILFLVLYVRYRFVFRDAAVEVQDGLAKADIPRVVDAPPGVITGAPELVVSMPTRYLAGRLGTCRIEFYAAGVQIWTGPEKPEPRWQFPYQDLLQAESVVESGSGTRNSRDQYALRLVAAKPRMAFLFGSSFSDSETQMMLSELGKHGVRTFSEA